MCMLLNKGDLFIGWGLRATEVDKISRMVGDNAAVRGSATLLSDCLDHVLTECEKSGLAQRTITLCTDLWKKHAFW